MAGSYEERQLSGVAAAHAARQAAINALAKEAYRAYRECGQLSAFNDLLEKLYPYTRMTLRNSFGITNPDVREDLVQEIARRFLVYRNGYDEQRPFLAWWYSIVRNVRNDYLSEIKKRGFIDLSDSPREEVQFDSEKQVILQNALDQLCKDDREILVLHYIVGFTVPEIAELIDEKVDNVKYEIRRASFQLRELLKSRTAAPNRGTSPKPEDEPGASPPS